MSAEAEGKPITPRRLARMRGTLRQRQPDLTVVIEDVHDPHNVSAIIRSCEAVGVAAVHLVHVLQERPEISRGVAANAQRWLELRNHASIEDCYAELRRAGLQILATTLDERAQDLYALDLTTPCAFVFGNESLGVSDAAAAGADATVFIPMMGMVESLNVSVACGISLFEALRQRRAAGLYDAPRWSDDEVTQHLRNWLEREGRDPAAATLPLDDTTLPRPRNRYEYRPDSN